MAQFYNDVIEEAVNELTEVLVEKDSDINILIGNLFDDYVNDNKKYAKDKFMKKFNNIFTNVFFQTAEKIFLKQNMENIEKEKATLKKEYLKDIDVKVTTKNLEAFYKEYEKKIVELGNNSYTKYKNTIKAYDRELKKLEV